MYSAFFVNRGGEQISGISKIRPGQTIPYGIFAISIDEESGNLQWKVDDDSSTQSGSVPINGNRRVANCFYLGFFEVWDDADYWIRKEMRRTRNSAKKSTSKVAKPNSIPTETTIAGWPLCLDTIQTNLN